MRVLELFSGTGSVGKELKRVCKGAEIVSLDIHPKYNPTHATDILRWDYKQLYSPGHFDVIWASPPCTEYSVAKTVGERDLELADRIVKRALAIIRHLRPKYWFVENPGAGGLLDKRPFMKPYERFKNPCTYCHYGKPFRKPTNIWTNLKGLNLRYCGGNDRCAHKRRHGRHAQSAQHSTSSQEYYQAGASPGSVTADNVYPIPRKLVRHIANTLLKALYQ